VKVDIWIGKIICYLLLRVMYFCPILRELVYLVSVTLDTIAQGQRFDRPDPFFDNLKGLPMYCNRYGG